MSNITEAWRQTRAITALSLDNEEAARMAHEAQDAKARRRYIKASKANLDRIIRLAKAARAALEPVPAFDGPQSLTPHRSGLCTRAN